MVSGVSLAHLTSTENGPISSKIVKASSEFSTLHFVMELAALLLGVNVGRHGTLFLKHLLSKSRLITHILVHIWVLQCTVVHVQSR
uniref:Uncharacterized protein n=1 Tax=Anguilla anguilla TaxID=7936 RepID=A0A0E9WM07_ANGAN